MTNVLTPNAKQQFFDNNGKPLVGGKLFTYAAGSSTKLATKVSPAGADNANPIILDYRGECNLWIGPNVAYKYVLAPPTDTDPPTHAIWTVDSIVSSQLITLYGGLDTGSANVYALTFTSNFTAYADGILVYWIPAHTNTGPSTLNINGLGAVPILSFDGNPLTAGQIVLNTTIGVLYRGGSFYLLAPIQTSGSFTATLSGMTTVVTGTVFYRIVNGIASLFVIAQIVGTSNATSMIMTGLPTALTGGGFARNIISSAIDNAVERLSLAQFDPTLGRIVFAPLAVVGASIPIISGLFTAAGAKGVSQQWEITFPL